MPAARTSEQLNLFHAAPRAPEFDVRISGRARRLTVRVYPGGRVEVTVPPGTRPLLVERFVAQHRAWIDARVADFRLRTPPQQQPLPERVALRALDLDWQVEYERGLRRAYTTAAPGRLVVQGGPHEMAATRERLRAWLLAEGHVGLAPWLGRVARTHGFAYDRVQVRRQRTRWGSCSRRGTISLNVSLLFQPAEVVEYLFVHELAHTRHMNHSARFWALVGACCPDWRDLDRELVRGWKHVPDWVYA